MRYQNLEELRTRVYFDQSKFRFILLISFIIASIVPGVLCFYLERISWSQFIGLSILAYVIAAIVDLVIFKDDLKDMKKWKSLPLIEAEVTDCLPTGIDVELYIPTVKFKYEGKDYHFTATRVVRGKRFRIGSLIVLLFDPKDPASSFDLEGCTFLSIAEVCGI